MSKDPNVTVAPYVKPTPNDTSEKNTYYPGDRKCFCRGSGCKICRRCDYCDGTGRQGSSHCAQCGGTGIRQ